MVSAAAQYRPQVALKLDIALHWTPIIVDEWLRNLDDGQRARCEGRTIPLMEEHFPEACLTAVPPASYGRTDPKDRHVAAAAVHIAPSVLVTWNLADFDVARLASMTVAVRTPDRFLSDLYDRYPELVTEASREAQANLSRSAPSWDDYRVLLSRIGLNAFAERLVRHRSGGAS